MTHFRLNVAGAALLAAMELAGTARADIRDYEYQLVRSELAVGDGVTVDVRLVDTRTGSPVTDAVIFATRLDMAPDNMETMTAPLEPVASGEPGVYRFRTRLVMAGGWRLSLAAKIQGEEGTLQTRFVFKAVDR